jgi:hypothetical protein
LECQLKPPLEPEAAADAKEQFPLLELELPMQKLLPPLRQELPPM